MVLLGAVVGHLCCADRDFRQTGLGGYQFRLRNLDPYRDDLVAATGKWSNPLQRAARTWTFLGLSALATGASWVAYFRALQVGRAAQVAAVDKLSLLLVAVFAVMFLGERPATREWLGIALVGAGVLVLGFKRL